MSQLDLFAPETHGPDLIDRMREAPELVRTVYRCSDLPGECWIISNRGRVLRVSGFHAERERAAAEDRAPEVRRLAVLRVGTMEEVHQEVGGCSAA